MSNLPLFILKRDGSKVNFDQQKITLAVQRAGAATSEFGENEAELLSSRVIDVIRNMEDNEKLTVEMVQDVVENVLLDSEYKATAKAYILYRDHRAAERKPDLFKKRLNLKPYEYPELAEYVDAIRHSYWIHTEFNYTSDIQDFKVNVVKLSGWPSRMLCWRLLRLR